MFSGCELLVSMEVRRPSPCDTMRQEEKHVYLVMECCEGGDIGERAGCPRCSEIRISEPETLVFLIIQRMLALDLNHILFIIYFTLFCFTAMLKLFVSCTDLVLLHLIDRI